MSKWIACPGPAGKWPCLHPEGLGHGGDHIRVIKPPAREEVLEPEEARQNVIDAGGF